MDDLKSLLGQHNLKLVQKSEHHFQITGGKFLVNYYPSKGTVYVNGMTKGKRHLEPQQLVQIALGKMLPDGVKKAPRRSMSSARRRLFRRSDICAICNGRMRFEDATVDHIIPLLKGGSNRADNLQLVHAKCNSKKGSMI